MKKTFVLVVYVFFVVSTLFSLTLGEIVQRVVENDFSVGLANTSVAQVRENKELTRLHADGEISLNILPYRYNLSRIQDFESFTPIGIPKVDLQTHSFGLGLSFDQPLPGSGVFSTNLEDRFSINDKNSTITYEQEPQFSLSLLQPFLFANEFISTKPFRNTNMIADLKLEQEIAEQLKVSNTAILSALRLIISVLDNRMQELLLKDSIADSNRIVEELQIRKEQGNATEEDVLSALLAVDRLNETLLSVTQANIRQELEILELLQLDKDVSEEIEADFFENWFTVVPQSVSKDIYGNFDYQKAIRDLDIARRDVETADLQFASTFQSSFSLRPRYPDERDQKDQITGSFSDFFSGNEGVGTDISFTMNVEIPLSNGAKRESQRKLLMHNVDRFQQILDSTEMQILRAETVLRRQYELLLSKTAILNNEKSLAETKLVRLKELAERSVIPELDVSRADVELKQVERKIWKNRGEIFINRLEIYSLYGVDLRKVF